ncbi:TetR/AcrR family transcriptional regulator [Streptomyces sp. NPDC055105]|uniref:TetR/AcrR family transcriptional regulator n=1 Tax=Streptomyces sp. NPDC055105 TaxID=3365719 RepID=UPI0037D88ED4
MSSAAPPHDNARTPSQLPLLGAAESAGQSVRTGRPMRADAVRNRALLLEAAARLVAEDGVEHVTMDAVARAASVGKGTLFRHFGDRSRLLMALLDHAEQDYQASFLTGPPPLGAGAPALERLEAFGVATIRYLLAHREISLAAAPPPERRFSAPPIRVRRAHIVSLLREAGAEGDMELLAESLLAYLDTALLNHLIHRRGISQARVEAGWRNLLKILKSSGDGA